MRRVTVSIEETIVYRHDVIVETELSDEEIGIAFDAQIEKSHHQLYFGDIVSFINGPIIKVVEVNRDEDGEPEMECYAITDYVDPSELDDADDDLHDGEDIEDPDYAE